MPVKEEGKAGRLGTTHECNAALREPWQFQKEALQKHLQRSPWQYPSHPTVCSVLKSVALAQMLCRVLEVLQMEVVGYFTLCSSTASSFLTIWQHFSVPGYWSSQVRSIGTGWCALKEEMDESNLLFLVNKLYKGNKHHLEGIVKVAIKWSEIFQIRLTLTPFFFNLKY